jgi:hypothetical protein
MRACAPLWLFKHKALQFWLIYCEKFGTPGLHAETSAQKDGEDWLAIEDALRKFGQEWGIVTAPGTKITPVDVSTHGEMAYPKLIEWVDKEMSTLWRGGDLSTQSHHGGGQGQGASLQGQELASMEQGDTAWVSDVMHEQLDRYAIRYATGDAVPLASIKFKTAPMKDTANDLLIDQFLLSNGFPISVEEAAQRYEREIPDAGEDLLKPAVQADAEEVGKVTGNVEGKGAGNERAPVLPHPRMVFAANEAPAAANATREGDHPALAPMLAKARVRLARAEQAALKPLAARLQELYADAVNQTPAEFAAALNTFREHELPALAKKIMGHGDTEQIFAEAIAAALVTGLTEKNRSKA